MRYVIVQIPAADTDDRGQPTRPQPKLPDNPIRKRAAERYKNNPIPPMPAPPQFPAQRQSTQALPVLRPQTQALGALPGWLTAPIPQRPRETATGDLWTLDVQAFSPATADDDDDTVERPEPGLYWLQHMARQRQKG